MKPFLGTFHNKVDGKGRVSVPAPFRARLGEDPSGFGGVVVFRSYQVQALECCGMGYMEDLNQRVDDFGLFSDEQQGMAAILFGSAQELPWDSGGRIQIPRWLLDEVGITENAAFFGMGKTFRIWDPPALDAFVAEQRATARARGFTLPPSRGSQGGAQ